MKIIEQRKELNRRIKRSKVIFLMAHKDLDLDALGSCIGLSLILKQRKKTCYIIVDDKEHELGVEKILKELDGCIPIVRGEDIDKYLYPNNKKNLLIVLDTNKTELVQNKEILKKIDQKVIIDHHDFAIPADYTEAYQFTSFLGNLIGLNPFAAPFLRTV